MKQVGGISSNNGKAASFTNNTISKDKLNVQGVKDQQSHSKKATIDFNNNSYKHVRELRNYLT